MLIRTETYKCPFIKYFNNEFSLHPHQMTFLIITNYHQLTYKATKQQVCCGFKFIFKGYRTLKVYDECIKTKSFQFVSALNENAVNLMK